MIDIDDAGWGDMVDGTVLGFLRVESSTFISKVIDVRFFQPPLFAEKAYLDEALRLSREALKELAVDKSEELRICTGPVLEKVRKTLSEEGYKVTPSKIVGELQTRVEMAFIKRLEKLGVTENAVPLDPGRDRFYVQLRWIHGNLARREKYVKTAYRSWKRWRLWKPHEKPMRVRTARTHEEEWGPW